MMTTFADYQRERRAFQALLKSPCDKRILLFRGVAGTGKTSLIMECQKDVCSPVFQVPIQLRGAVVGIAEILQRTVNQLGWQCLPHFNDQLASFGTNRVNIDHAQLQGESNQINVVLQGLELNDRQERQAILTSAWFEDVRRLDGLLLMVMDTYENAATEVKDWISGPFLTRASDVNNIRVAIAGQEVPEANTIEGWGNCCDRHELFGVPQAEHWLPVVKNMGRVIPVDHPLDWLAGICHVLNGHPDAIMKIIQALPRQH